MIVTSFVNFCDRQACPQGSMQVLPL